MKRISVLILLVIACVCFTENVFAQTAKAKKVAVYVQGKIDNEDKSIINSAFLARMSGNSDYAPFERNEAFLTALTKEHDFQISDEVPDSEIRKVGTRLGVDYVIVVNVIVASDGKWHITAELLDLETGAILKTVKQHRECFDSGELSNFASNVAYRLLNKKSR